MKIDVGPRRGHKGLATGIVTRKPQPDAVEREVDVERLLIELISDNDPLARRLHLLVNGTGDRTVRNNPLETFLGYLIVNQSVGSDAAQGYGT